MRLLEPLAAAFIATFGITEPDEKTRRKASWFIFGLMVAALIVICVIGGIFWRLFHA